MVDIQQAVNSSMSFPHHSRGSSGTEESTVPASTQYSDWDTSSEIMSSLNILSASPTSSLLNESLEFLESVGPVQESSRLFYLPGNGTSLLGDLRPGTSSLYDELEFLTSNGKPLALCDNVQEGTTRVRNSDSEKMIGGSDIGLDLLDRDLFRPISGNTSRQSTPRTRLSDDSPRTSSLLSTGMSRTLKAAADDAEMGCSPDASTLYGTRARHFNPSGAGQRAYKECMEYRQWANGYLKYSPHQTVIADLSRDLADGLTLLHLVEVLLDDSMQPIHIRPALEVQRSENIQACLDVLGSSGVNIGDIPTEDIVKGNTKVVLAFCKCLRNHFGSSPGSSVLLNAFAKRNTPSPLEKQRSCPTSACTIPTGRQDRTSPRHSTPSPFAVLDREDLALLNWVSSVTNSKVTDYGSFQDGHTLCLLVNKLTGEDAIPGVVLQHGLPSEKISLSLELAREELGIDTVLTTEDVRMQTNHAGLPAFLKLLHRVFIEQLEKEQEETEKLKFEELSRKANKLEERQKEKDEFIRRFHQQLRSRNLPKIESTSLQGSHPIIPTIGQSKFGNLPEERSPRNTKGTSLPEFFPSARNTSHNTTAKQFRTVAIQSDSSDELPSSFFSESKSSSSHPRNFSSTNSYFLDQNSNRNESKEFGSSKLVSTSHMPSTYFQDAEDTRASNPLNRSSSNTSDLSRIPATYFPANKGNNMRHSPNDSIYARKPESYKPESYCYDQFDSTLPKESSPNKLDSGLKTIPLLKTLVPKESIFDAENLRIPFQGTIAGKSNKKKCEEARIKVAELNHQLQLLKLQYTDCMIMPMVEDSPQSGSELRNSIPDASSFIVQPESMMPNEELPSIFLSNTMRLSPNDSRQDKSKPNDLSKSLSKVRYSDYCLQSYSSLNEGTFPPYRTWSIFVGDGEIGRESSTTAKANFKAKNNLMNGRNSSSPKNISEESGRGQINSPNPLPPDTGSSSNQSENSRDHPSKGNGELGKNGGRLLGASNTKRLSTMPNAFPGFSPQNEKVTLAKAGNAVTDRVLPDGEERTGHVTNRVPHGLTALIRLSSKKANAVTDNDSKPVTPVLNRKK